LRGRWWRARSRRNACDGSARFCPELRTIRNIRLASAHSFRSWRSWAGSGLVASLARPGGNVTGLSAQSPDIAGKRLALLREVAPNLRRVAFMGNVEFPFVLSEWREVQAGAGTLGLEASTSEIRRPQDIVPAFEALKHRSEAVYLASDGLVAANRLRINILALGARLPTIWTQQELAEAGGLCPTARTSPTSSGAQATSSIRSCAVPGPRTFPSSSRPSSIW
jgi:ABC-type uncharacterized transport system substrate-binding protein